MHFIDRADHDRLLDDECNSRTVAKEINQRFLEHGIGYQFQSGQIIVQSNSFLHAETIAPALTLLSDSQFDGANEEFLKAHEHYRHGRHAECLVECLKAFESTMKIICDIKPVQHVKKQIEIFNREEIASIRVAIKDSHFKAMIEFMLEVGTRPGETTALKWGDLKDGMLKVERTATQDEDGLYYVSDTTKTKAGRRTIPLSDRMMGLLGDYRSQLKKATDSDWMFQTLCGRMIGQQFRSNILGPILKAANVSYRKPHTFRHTAASTMLNGGVPVSIVSAILGHENPSITLSVYSHLIESDKLAAKKFWDRPES